MANFLIFFSLFYIRIDPKILMMDFKTLFVEDGQSEMVYCCSVYAEKSIDLCMLSCYKEYGMDVLMEWMYVSSKLFFTWNN
jgi:hypothetical protein